MRKIVFILTAVVHLTVLGPLFARIPDGIITVPVSKEETSQVLNQDTEDTAVIHKDNKNSKLFIKHNPKISSESKRSIRKAQKLFGKANLLYEKEKKEKAKEYYLRALEELQSANLSNEVNYYLKDDFDNLFLKVNELFSGDYSSKEIPYRIPIDAENEQVKKYLEIFSSGKPKERIQRALQRAGRYRDMIFPILRKYDLPRELIYLPVVESLYTVSNRSRAGALGLWQFMTSTGRGYGLRINYWIDERMDAEKSTIAAAKYLRRLYFLFDDWHLALAAYNRGEFGLKRDMKFSQAIDIDQMKKRKAVPRETQNYVPQFIAVTIIGDNPKKYGYNLEYEKPPEYDVVTVSQVMDLKIVAGCTNVTLKRIKELNPAIKAWCTPHNYPDFKLKIPKGTKQKFLENIAKIKDLNPTKGFIKYKVRRGDYLGKIAKKFHTSVRRIKNDNKLHGKKYLQRGKILIIRPGKRYYK
ncbi:transglycosylase SLT domain-containing protein [Elusimicrobiota bacterium]